MTRAVNIGAHSCDVIFLELLLIVMGEILWILNKGKVKVVAIDESVCTRTLTLQSIPADALNTLLHLLHQDLHIIYAQAFSSGFFSVRVFQIQVRAIRNAYRCCGMIRARCVT